MTSPQDTDDWIKGVLAFWFGELGPEDWFASRPDLDATIRDRFAALHARLAAEGVPEVCRRDPRAALAAIIALDQFPRNIHRGQAAAFSTDDLAVSLARNAIDAGFDEAMSDQERQFVYMPLMHSENLADQERCVDLFGRLGNEEGLRYAIEHRDIVRDFGRFPHRNRALGRETTKAERTFLEGHAGYGQ
jgi:uncharacterized protein (DUF924 family)